MRLNACLLLVVYKLKQRFVSNFGENLRKTVGTQQGNKHRNCENRMCSCQIQLYWQRTLKGIWQMFKKGSCFSFAAVKTRRLLTDQPLWNKTTIGTWKRQPPNPWWFLSFRTWNDTTEHKRCFAGGPLSSVQICPSIEWRQMTGQAECLM